MSALNTPKDVAGFSAAGVNSKPVGMVMVGVHPVATKPENLTVGDSIKVLILNRSEETTIDFHGPSAFAERPRLYKCLRERSSRAATYTVRSVMTATTAAMREQMVESQSATRLIVLAPRLVIMDTGFCDESRQFCNYVYWKLTLGTDDGSDQNGGTQGIWRYSREIK